MRKLSRILLALCTIGLLSAPATSQVHAVPPRTDEPAISVTIRHDMIQWQINTAYGGAVLTVAAPDNVIYTLEFPQDVPPQLPVANADGARLQDGTYTFELSVTPLSGAGAASPGENGRDATAAADTSQVPAEALVESGYFSVAEGAFLLPDLEEPAAEGDLQAAESSSPQATNDFVISDDLIVDGSACIGFDCVNGEVFGFDTLRLKENNLRIKFDDTSVAASFPSNDWQLTANDSANGGKSKFSIDDISNARTPFTVEANAPSHSLYVEDGGRVGLGTSTPVVALHIKEGDTPTVRLEQDNTSGFTAQTWDLAGNETNFFIRDVTNGSRLPFRIRPNAPTSSIDIEGTTGDVGIGTTSPEAPIHIRRTNGTAKLLVEEDSGTEALRVMAQLTNNGDSRISLNNTATSVEWQIGPTGTFLAISKNGTGGPELAIHENGRFRVGPGAVDNLNVEADGDVTILGTLTTGGPQCGAGCVAAAEVVNGQSVLNELSTVPVESWSETVVDETYDVNGDLVDSREYTVRHLSPVASSFNTAFNTGVEGNQIAPLDVATVALMGTQELRAELSQLQSQVSDLQQENRELKNRLAAIESALGIQGNSGEDNSESTDDSAQQTPLYLPNVSP